MSVKNRSIKASTNNWFYSLASYHEVSRQFPSKKLRTQVQNFCGNAKAWKKKWDSNLGVLFKVPFWRVILDEAHSIKNRESQSKFVYNSGY